MELGSTAIGCRHLGFGVWQKCYFRGIWIDVGYMRGVETANLKAGEEAKAQALEAIAVQCFSWFLLPASRRKTLHIPNIKNYFEAFWACIILYVSHLL